MSSAADRNLQRLCQGAFLLLVGFTLLGTLLQPQVRLWSAPSLLFCAGVALYTAMGFFFRWDKEGRPPMENGYYVVQLALFVGFMMLEIPTGFLYLLAMPVISQAAMGGRLHVAVLLALAYLLAMLIGYQPNGLALGPSLSIAVSMMSAFAFVTVFSLLVKSSMRSRSRAEELACELEQANAQLREQSARESALAAANERNRIARDIHDGLGHYLTVIAVQLEAARALLKDEPSRAAETMAKAEALSRDALEEVRRSVGALRTHAPAPELGEALRGLVRESGPQTHLSFLGKPRRHADAIEQALFRTVQEGLTNTRKHAHARRVDVLVDYTDDARTVVEIRDDGVGSPEMTMTAGNGLRGLRERLAAVGGGLTAGQGPTGGFSLRAEVPA